MRAYEQCLVRLGLDTVDALIIHDLDVVAAHGEHHAGRLRDLAESGIKALEELKRNGQIKAIGMGLNVSEALDTVAPLVDLDFVIVAMPYTLLDQSALHSGMQRFVDKKISVIVGAPYASGILVTGPGPNAKYRYQPAPADVQEKARRIQAACARHGVSLPAAALQFPLAHPAVVAIIPGSASPDEVRRNVGYFAEAIPAALWAELKAEGLVDPAAPTPSE
jgi:D-threo-aldose 1-dehydrogenase